MTKFSYYGKLFERLGIKNVNQALMALIAGEHDFYEKYAPVNSKLIQVGGVKQFKYKYDEHDFIIHEDMQDDKISYSIINNDESICILLLIPLAKHENYVYIDNISFHENCSINGMPKTRGGSLLLQMTLHFINDILKDKYNLKYIQLKDNSLFHCKQTNTTIDLDSMYMLTRGNTWYGKYGFIPFNWQTKSIDLETYTDYKTNQRLVNIIPVGCTKIREYLVKAVYKLNTQHIFSEEWITKTFEIYNDIPVIKFFRDFLKKYDQTCGVFSLIYKDVMKDLHITNLHGKTYYKRL